MAFGFVRSGQNAGTSLTSINVTFGSPVTQGNLIVISFRTSVDITDLTVTDNASVPNTYVVAQTNVGANVTQRLIYGVAITGGATQIQFSWTGSVSARPTVDEYSGNVVSNASVFDTSAGATGTGTSMSVSLTPSAAGELIVAGITNVNAGGTMSAGSGFTITNVNNVNSSEYKLSGTTSETPSATLTTSQQWNIVAGAFKESPVVASSTGGTLLMMGA